jgi:hypothetical protein
MKTMKVIATVCLLILSIAAALPTMAATITQTKDFSGTPNYTSPLTFDKFNVPGATLSSIKVTLNLSVSGGQLVVDNDGVDPATVDVYLGAGGNLTSSDVTLKDASDNAIPAYVTAITSNTFNLGAENGDGPLNVDSTAPDGAVHNGGNASDSEWGYIGSAYYPGFTGTGTYDVTANMLQALFFGGIGGVEGSFTPVSTNGNVEVVYDYEVVPEPSGIVALLTGVGGVLGMGLRRRR